LARKPPRFLELASTAGRDAATAKVPLLECADGVIVESLDIARHLTRSTPLYPAGDSVAVDGFIELWCETVERTYYDVLRAGCNAEARSALAAFITALSQLEDRLWQQRMQRR